MYLQKITSAILTPPTAQTNVTKASKCRPAASLFDDCIINTDHAEKWGWPPAEEAYFQATFINNKKTFAEAEEACPS